MTQSPEHEPVRVVTLYEGLYDDKQGVPVYMNTVAGYMNENGYPTTHIVGAHHEGPQDGFVEIGSMVTSKGNGNEVPRTRWISRDRIDEIWDETKPDIVHLQTPHNPLVAGRMLSRLDRDVPVVASFHVLPDSLLMNGLLRGLGGVVRASGQIDKMLSNSPATKAFVRQAYGMNSRLIPCPIDLEALSGAKPMERFDDGKINIGYMGRLVERKGVQHLVEAVACLKPDPEKVRLLIAGKGPLEEDLKKRVADSDLGGMTEFLGFVPDEEKASFFASCDIAVLPATGGESFGIVLAEAMAAGSGVVMGGNNPGYEGTLGRGAFELFNPYDTHVLETKLWRLMNERDLRDEIHARQQERVKDFDISVVGPQIAQVYEDLTR